MKMALCLALLFSASFALAQSNQPSNNKNENGMVTVRGCVTMLNGDYVLTKQDPANTYQLQKAEHIKLRTYLGKQVEITGTKSETIPSSEDAINGRLGNASPVTITIKSIKTLSKECRD
jgi:hypothetical protein